MTLSQETAPARRCRWCGRSFEPNAGAGRPRQFCKRSCRQRDYETRRRGAEIGLGEDELIITRAELNELKDRIYVLAETVDDVEKDLTDNAEDDERRLLNVLLHAAKQTTAATSSATVEALVRTMQVAGVRQHYRRNEAPHSAVGASPPVPPIMRLM